MEQSRGISMVTDKALFCNCYRDRFAALFGKPWEEGTLSEYYLALAGQVRDKISENWIKTKLQYSQKNEKQAYYFSIEFLPGRFLTQNLINLGYMETVREALAGLGLDLEKIQEQEQDPGLGNGGLGRLAAGFLDSLAALGLPGHGMGIRYRYGFFEQKIVNGSQVELPDNWLKCGNSWEYRRPEEAVVIPYGYEHENYEVVRAVPYDIPIVGYRNDIVNTLRLWSAEPAEAEFEYHTFSCGDYSRAFAQKNLAEAVSQVLYPDDSCYGGQRLRLKQEYFLASASLQSIVRDYKKRNADLRYFPEKVALHINDTHPALVIPELMRILLDEESLSWEEAWTVATSTVSFTNHTILPEASEKWPVELFRGLLPRVYMIVEEINKRFCADIIRQAPDKSAGIIKETAIIWDGFIRMGNLAVIGSNSVNGVARIHTGILKQIIPGLVKHFPGKFNNKTNGITQRKWLLAANPRLSEAIDEAIGSAWIKDPTRLLELSAFARDAGFRQKITQVKQENKNRLADYIRKKTGIVVDTHSVFDIHIKRIHAYKRQLLNILHIMDLYNRLRENPDMEILPRTFIFGGKAAPAYKLAKETIKLINTVGEVINTDPALQKRIRVVFLENYNVSLAELAFPAADVSEQISTAGKEASGTGNMKFMMNGAVTLGTLDGANVEIREQVGEENFITFGMTAEEVWELSHSQDYCSWNIYQQDPRIRTICEQLINGFLPVDPGEFRGIYDHLLRDNDEYFVLQDFASYARAQRQVDKRYRDRSAWTGMCIQNIAHSGYFSSDRAVREYAAEIWKIY